MDVMYRGSRINIDAEKHVIGGVDIFIVEHPETGMKTRLTQFYVDNNNKPLHRVCTNQSNCTKCMMNHDNVNNDSCVYGKYSGYPTEYFIVY